LLEIHVVNTATQTNVEESEEALLSIAASTKPRCTKQFIFKARSGRLDKIQSLMCCGHESNCADLLHYFR